MEVIKFARYFPLPCTLIHLYLNGTKTRIKCLFCHGSILKLEVDDKKMIYLVCPRCKNQLNYNPEQIENNLSWSALKI